MTDVRKHGAVPNDRQPAVLLCHVGHQLLDQHGHAFHRLPHKLLHKHIWDSKFSLRFTLKVRGY